MVCANPFDPGIHSRFSLCVWKRWAWWWGPFLCVWLGGGPERCYNREPCKWGWPRVSSWQSEWTLLPPAGTIPREENVTVPHYPIPLHLWTSRTMLQNVSFLTPYIVEFGQSEISKASALILRCKLFYYSFFSSTYEKKWDPDLRTVSMWAPGNSGWSWGALVLWGICTHCPVTVT